MGIGGFKRITGVIGWGLGEFTLPGSNAAFCRSILKKGAVGDPLRLESLSYVLPQKKEGEIPSAQQPVVVNLLMQLRAYYDESNAFLRQQHSLQLQLTRQLDQALSTARGSVSAQARQIRQAVEGEVFQTGQFQRALSELTRELKKNGNNEKKLMLEVRMEKQAGSALSQSPGPASASKGNGAARHLSPVPPRTPSQIQTQTLFRTAAFSVPAPQTPASAPLVLAQPGEKEEKWEVPSRQQSPNRRRRETGAPPHDKREGKENNSRRGERENRHRERARGSRKREQIREGSGERENSPQPPVSTGRTDGQKVLSPLNRESRETKDVPAPVKEERQATPLSFPRASGEKTGDTAHFSRSVSQRRGKAGPESRLPVFRPFPAFSPSRSSPFQREGDVASAPWNVARWGIAAWRHGWAAPWRQTGMPGSVNPRLTLVWPQSRPRGEEGAQKGMAVPDFLSPAKRQTRALARSLPNTQTGSRTPWQPEGGTARGSRLLWRESTGDERHSPAAQAEPGGRGEEVSSSAPISVSSQSSQAFSLDHPAAVPAEPGRGTLGTLHPVMPQGLVTPLAERRQGLGQHQEEVFSLQQSEVERRTAFTSASLGAPPLSAPWAAAFVPRRQTGGPGSALIHRSPEEPGHSGGAPSSSSSWVAPSPNAEEAVFSVTLPASAFPRQSQRGSRAADSAGEEVFATVLPASVFFRFGRGHTSGNALDGGSGAALTYLISVFPQTAQRQNPLRSLEISPFFPGRPHENQRGGGNFPPSVSFPLARPWTRGQEERAVFQRTISPWGEAGETRKAEQRGSSLIFPSFSLSFSPPSASRASSASFAQFVLPQFFPPVGAGNRQETGFPLGAAAFSKRAPSAPHSSAAPGARLLARPWRGGGWKGKKAALGMHRAETPYPLVPLSPLRGEEGKSLAERAEPLEPVFRTSLEETLGTGGEPAGAPEEMGRWKEPDRAFSLPVLAKAPGQHRTSRSAPGVTGGAPRRSQGTQSPVSGGIRRGYGLSALLAQNLESPAPAWEEPVGEMVHTAFSPEPSLEGPAHGGEKAAPSREPSGGTEPSVVYRLPPRPPALPQKEEETGEDVLRAQSVDPGYVSAMNAAYSYQAPQSRPRPEIPGAISQEIEEQIVRQVLEDLNYNRMAAQVLERVERRLRTERRKFGR